MREGSSRVEELGVAGHPWRLAHHVSAVEVATHPDDHEGVGACGARDGGSHSGRLEALADRDGHTRPKSQDTLPRLTPIRLSPSDGDEPERVEQIDGHTRSFTSTAMPPPTTTRRSIAASISSRSPRVTTVSGGYMLRLQPAGCAQVIRHL